MKKMVRIAVAVTLAVISVAARAQIIIPPTMVSFTGSSGGLSLPSDQLAITYEVTLNAGLYTYSYILTAPPSNPLLSFTLGGPIAPVDTQTVSLLNLGQTVPGLDGVLATSIIFGWSLPSDVTSDSISYTSVNGPTLATFTANDDDVVWGSPAAIPAPAPMAVPEASTVLAGATMLFPLGASAFHAARRRILEK